MPVQQYPRREWQYDNNPSAAPQRDQSFTPNVGTFFEFNNSTVAVGSTVNEVQTVTLSSYSGSDTYTLSFGSLTSTAITVTNHNLSATTSGSVRYALNEILGSGNWATNLPSSGTPSTSQSYTVTFQGTLAATDVAMLTAPTQSGCTVSFSETTKGILGPWTVPAGIYRLSEVLIVGGGGGGGSGASGSAGAGGAGGQVKYLRNVPVVPGDTITVTIGAGGSGGNGTSVLGTDGGSTTMTIGSTAYTATGGKAADNSNNAGAASGTRGTFNPTSKTYSAAGGVALSGGQPLAGGAGIAEAFGADSPATGNAGSSPGGLGGIAGYGGGGGAASQAQAGTNGGRGGEGGGGGGGGRDVAGGSGGTNTGGGGGGGSGGAAGGAGGSGYLAFYYTGI